MIAAKIDGQGSAVDVGSALPSILNGILQLIPDAANPDDVYNALSVSSSKAIFDIESSQGLNHGACCQLLGVTTGELTRILHGKVFQIKFMDGVLLNLVSGKDGFIYFGEHLSVEYDKDSGLYDVFVTSNE